MIAVGYMAKNVAKKPDWLISDSVTDIYSVQGCSSHDFADYIKFWKHNGYWFFDTPEIINQVASENAIDMTGMTFFYYEAYEKQYDEEEKSWNDFEPEPSFPTNVRLPEKKQLEGYDVVPFSVQTSAECSVISCCNLAQFTPVNAHCLLETFDEAKAHLESGKFSDTEPGPFRIFAVYTLPGIATN
jgi:hypothetical protein